MSSSTIRKPQIIANWLFHHLSSWRSLAGLSAIIVLSGISVTFNFQLGKMMGSDQITRELFPVGFATLDLAALFLAAWLTMKSRSLIRKGLAWLWFGYLLSLSVWAAMSFTLASDARLSQSGYEMMKDAKVRALEQSEEQVALAQDNYEETTRYKKLRMAELREAQSIRDGLIKDIAKLNNDNPHVSMAIYYRSSALLHNHFDKDIDPKDLSSIVRMLWALALTLSPFILTTLIAFEVASYSPQSRRQQPLPDEQEYSTYAPRNTERWGEPSPNFGTVAKSDDSPHFSKEVGEVVELDREALSKVRDWLRSQEGRVSRRSIEHRAGTRKYAQVSLIIEALLKEGWLIRMSNKQLAAAKPELKAVG